MQEKKPLRDVKVNTPQHVTPVHKTPHFMLSTASRTAKANKEGYVVPMLPTPERRCSGSAPTTTLVPGLCEPVLSNMGVAVRIRPFMEDADGSCHEQAFVVDDQAIHFRSRDDRSEHTFLFDNVFSGGSDQREVFQTLGKPMVQEALVGFNTCLFAYGQTGSGKTWSLLGGDSPETRGFLPRLCECLFEEAQSKLLHDPTLSFTAKLSFYELYNERCRDLLNECDGLEIVEREKKFLVKDLSQCTVLNAAHMMQLISRGSKRRITAHTAMNAESSRAHCIVQLALLQENVETGIRTENTILVADLAGSERQGKTDSQDSERFEEMKNINLSLLTLGRALSFVTEKESRENPPTPVHHLGTPAHGAAQSPRELHTPREKRSNHAVPFIRESKLTQLLADVFGGNCKVTMLATISPSVSNVVESVCTLEYAANARAIVTHALINQRAATEVVELQNQIGKLCNQLDSALHQLKMANQTIDQLNDEKQAVMNDKQTSDDAMDRIQIALEEQKQHYLQVSQNLDSREQANTAQELCAVETLNRAYLVNDATDIKLRYIRGLWNDMMSTVMKNGRLNAREISIKEMEENAIAKQREVDMKQNKLEARLAELSQQEVELARRSKTQTQIEANAAARLAEFQERESAIAQAEKDLEEKLKGTLPPDRSVDNSTRQQEHYLKWEEDLQAREECLKEKQEALKETERKICASATAARLSLATSTPNHDDSTDLLDEDNLLHTPTAAAPQADQTVGLQEQLWQLQSQIAGMSHTNEGEVSLHQTLITEKCGWVWKYERLGPTHRWKKRWLIIRGGGFSFTKNPNDLPPSRKVTPLSVVYNVHEDPLHNLTDPKDDYMKEFGMAYCIEKKKYYIIAQSAADRIEWMHAFTDYLTPNTTPMKPPPEPSVSSPPAPEFVAIPFNCE